MGKRFGRVQEDGTRTARQGSVVQTTVRNGVVSASNERFRGLSDEDVASTDFSTVSPRRLMEDAEAARPGSTAGLTASDFRDASERNKSAIRAARSRISASGRRGARGQNRAAQRPTRQGQTAARTRRGGLTQASQRRIDRRRAARQANRGG